MLLNLGSMRTGRFPFLLLGTQQECYEKPKSHGESTWRRNKRLSLTALDELPADRKHQMLVKLLSHLGHGNPVGSYVTETLADTAWSTIVQLDIVNLYYIARVVIIKYHRLGGFKNTDLFSHNSGD